MGKIYGYILGLCVCSYFFFFFFAMRARGRNLGKVPLVPTNSMHDSQSMAPAYWNEPHTRTLLGSFPLARPRLCITSRGWLQLMIFVRWEFSWRPYWLPFPLLPTRCLSTQRNSFGTSLSENVPPCSRHIGCPKLYWTKRCSRVFKSQSMLYAGDNVWTSFFTIFILL